MRDINKSYKKIDWLRWQHRKNFIRINCAFMCAILLIILLLMFPVVSDASETKISDLYHFSSILNSDDALEYYSGEPYDTVLTSQNYRNIYYDKTTALTYEQSLKNLLDKSVDISSLNNPYITVIIKNSTEFYVFFHESTISAYSNYSNLNVNISSDGTNCLQYVYNTSTGSLLYMNTQGLVFSSSARCIFLLSTSPINYRWNPTGVNGEINYMLEQNQCGSGGGGLNIVPPYPEETSYNNLVLDQADFIFSHQSYFAPYNKDINTGNVYPIGHIRFEGTPNDYQKEHSNEFSLVFNFSFEYDVNYKWTHDYAQNNSGYFKPTSSLLGNKKNLKLTFLRAPLTVPLSTFIQNGNLQNWTIKDIWDNLYFNNDISLTTLMSQSKEIDWLEYNSFKLYCSCHIVANGKDSGSYEEWYNFNSKKGVTTDDSLKTNPDPYTPNPSDQADDDPDSTNIKPTPEVPGPDGSGGGGSSSSSAQANPNIVINNNPTFNNNPSASATASSDGSGSILSHLIDSLFGNGSVQEGSIGSNTQEKLITNTGANNWLGLFSTTLGFLPSSLWAEITLFVGIILGILVVAFILRIILDFL